MSFGRLFHSLTTYGKKYKVYDLIIPNNGLNLMAMQRWRTGRCLCKPALCCQ